MDTEKIKLPLPTWMPQTDEFRQKLADYLVKETLKTLVATYQGGILPNAN